MEKNKQLKNSREHREYKKISRIIDKAYKETVSSIKKSSDCSSFYTFERYQLQ